MQARRVSFPLLACDGFIPSKFYLSTTLSSLICTLWPHFLHSYSYCPKPGYPRSVRLWHRGEPLAASPIIFQGEISDHVAWIGANSTTQSSKCHLLSFCQGCLGLCIKTSICHPRLSWVTYQDSKERKYKWYSAVSTSMLRSAVSASCDCPGNGKFVKIQS